MLSAAVSRLFSPPLYLPYKCRQGTSRRTRTSVGKRIRVKNATDICNCPQACIRCDTNKTPFAAYLTVSGIDYTSCVGVCDSLDALKLTSTPADPNGSFRLVQNTSIDNCSWFDRSPAAAQGDVTTGCPGVETTAVRSPIAPLWSLGRFAGSTDYFWFLGYAMAVGGSWGSINGAIAFAQVIVGPSTVDCTSSLSFTNDILGCGQYFDHRSTKWFAFGSGGSASITFTIP